MDNKIFDKIERDLAKTGLLGIGKIKVVLRDGYLADTGLDVEIL